MNAPFQYGTLATKENFVDRVEDRAQLKNFLSSHINVMLVSPRRWGKSSLVKMAMGELQEEDKNVRVCYIDAFSIGSEAEFYRTFASQVIACASSKLEKRIQDAKKFLTGVVPQVVIKDDVTNFMAFDVKFVPHEQDKMDILRLPETLAQAKKIKIIVCIDEFQQLANLPEYKNMEGKMRSAWQQQERVTYCLYGSKRHMMLDIFNNSNSPSIVLGNCCSWLKFQRKSGCLLLSTPSRSRGNRSLMNMPVGYAIPQNAILGIFNSAATLFGMPPLKKFQRNLSTMDLDR